MDALTKSIIDKLASGYNIEQAASKAGVTPEEAFEVWQHYLKERKQMSWEEQWLLHLLRTENLLKKAYELIEMELDPKGIEATVQVLDRIEQLQALNLARKQEAEANSAALTRAQVDILFKVFEVMQGKFEVKLAEAFEQRTIKAIKGELVDDFPVQFKEIQRSAMEEVAANGES